MTLVVCDRSARLLVGFSSHPTGNALIPGARCNGRLYQETLARKDRSVPGPDACFAYAARGWLHEELSQSLPTAASRTEEVMHMLASSAGKPMKSKSSVQAAESERESQIF